MDCSLYKPVDLAIVNSLSNNYIVGRVAFFELNLLIPFLEFSRHQSQAAYELSFTIFGFKNIYYYK